MNVRGHWFRLTTLDLMASLPLIALGLFLVIRVEKSMSPYIDARAVLRAPQSVIGPVIGPSDATSVQAFLHSREAARAIGNDPLVIQRQKPWSADLLQQMLRQNLRAHVHPGTNLLVISMHVEAPNRDTAILNASVNTFMNGPGKGKSAIIEKALAPRLSTARHRSWIATAKVMSVLVLVPIALAAVKLARHLLSRRSSALPPL